MANRVANGVLIFVETVMGLAAVGGGLDLALTNGKTIGMPVELLEGSPFGSYQIPGLVLLAVGVFNLLAAASVLLGRPWSAQISVGAGVLWIGWFAVQVAVVGLINWQQPFYFAVGLLVVALASPPLVRRYRTGHPEGLPQEPPPGEKLR